MSDLGAVLTALNAHTAREEARLDRIGEHLAKIAAIQTEQKVILDEHIRRSVALEGIVDNISRRVAPLESTHLGWASLGRIVVALGAIVAALAAILKGASGP